jgi:hypothetical protein
MKYISWTLGLELSNYESEEDNIRISSNNIFSIEKLKLFDVWDFPKQDIKPFNSLEHLIHYYCRINDESNHQKSPNSLSKRSWEEYQGNPSKI